MTPVPEESEWPMDLKRLIELDPEVEAWDYWQPRARGTAPGPPLSQVGCV